MDRRVSESFPRSEDVPHYGSFTKSVRAGRVVFVLGSHPSCRKFSISERGREGVKSCVLYKQSIEGSRRTISADGEVSFCINNNF